VRTHLTVSLTLTAALAAVLWLGLGRHGTPWAGLIAWFAAATLTTFVYYGYDKRQARIGGRRVPELVLHTLAGMGGSVGAYAGMRAFRHKTVKGRFRVVFWLTVVAQVALLACAVCEALR
jgi:uncharacterized membrane protein YsdA (DUF1294 family)